MLNDSYIMRLCEVVSVDDNTDGDRIKVRLLPEDRGLSNSELPYVFPLLPKLIHVKPKVGEAVFVLCADLENPHINRRYIGPVISQMQFLEKCDYDYDANTLLSGTTKEPETALSMNANTNGAFPKDNDIALIGRKHSDVILSDDDLKIRCGARKITNDKIDNIYFNKEDPAYILLKYPNKKQNNDSRSSINIVADNINILSHKSINDYNLTDENDLITDEELNRIIESAHELPYGDKLVEFLKIFVTAFKTHTHPYAGLPPCTDSSFKALDEYNLNDILSKNIKIE